MIGWRVSAFVPAVGLLAAGALVWNPPARAAEPRVQNSSSEKPSSFADPDLVGAFPVELMTPWTSGGNGRSEEEFYTQERRAMVELVESRGVRQPEVLAAMKTVPRHRFVPPPHRVLAYRDRPLPIGSGQTISQPHVVAVMTELLELTGDEKVLEIGTGSGYHAAVLSRVAAHVYSIEILEELAQRARSVLEELDYDNVTIRVGDGYQGWKDEAPFDAIILTAAPPRIPQPLVDQLAEGGRMVAPVGRGVQDLQVISKGADGLVVRNVIPVRFGPMEGEAQQTTEPD